MIGDSCVTGVGGGSGRATRSSRSAQFASPACGLEWFNARISYLRTLGKANAVRMCQEMGVNLGVNPMCRNLEVMLHAIVNAEEESGAIVGPEDLRIEEEEENEEAGAISGKVIMYYVT